MYIYIQYVYMYVHSVVKGWHNLYQNLVWNFVLETIYSGRYFSIKTI